MTNDQLQEILKRPTCSIREAGAALGKGPAAAYKASKGGTIPVIQVNDTARVPTAWLRRVLQVDEAA